MDVDLKSCEYWEDDFSDRSSDIGSVRSETKSSKPQLISSRCYGRGKTISQIYLPRIPRDLKHSCISCEAPPTELAYNMLSAKLKGRSRGRGRAQVLKERIEQFESSSMSSSQESLPALLQAMEMPSRPGETAARNTFIPSVEKPSRNISDLAFFDLSDSATEDADEGDGDFVMPLLPSQRNFNFRPCVPPSQRKIVPNLTSVDDFPSLSSDPADKCEPELTTTVFSETRHGDSAIFARQPGLATVFSGTSHGDDALTSRRDAAVLSETRNTNGAMLDGHPEDAVDVTVACDKDTDLLDLPSNWTVKKSKHKSKTKKKLKGYQETEKPKDKKDSREVAFLNMSNPRTKNWDVKGDNVIQIEGLPLSGETSNLEELISSFGTVLHMEQRFLNEERVIRIRYNTQEACEWAVGCLHDSDCIFPDSCCVLVCSVVQN